MQNMQYRTCGISGLLLPEVSIGTWLTTGYSNDILESVKILRTALDTGCWFIDTADVYNKGEAERVVGALLKVVPRDEVVIGTKAFGAMSEHPLHKGLSRRHLSFACEQSLQRLGTDYIDLYQCHRYDASTPLTEVILTMQDLIHSGKIRYWGMSQWSAVQITNAVRLCELHNWIKPVSNQPIYNMINRSLEVDVMKVCENEGIGLICYSPLAQGLLSGKYTSVESLPSDSRAANSQGGKTFPFKRLTADNLDKIHQLKQIALELNLNMSTLALAWCLRVPCITSLITGASRPEQFTINAEASGITIPDDMLRKIHDILDNEPIDQYTGNRTGYAVDETTY